MKKTLLILMAVAVVMVMAGCRAVPLAERNQAQMLRIALGMPAASVLDIMGAPSKMEMYEKKNGEVWDFWFYVSLDKRTIPFDPTDSNESLLLSPRGVVPWNAIRDTAYIPICIVDGHVKGWGVNIYQNNIRIRKEIIED